MSFQVHVSDNMALLLDGLVPILKRPLSDPRQPEIIALQGLGMRAWLGRRLAERLGVWAHFQFPFPRDLMRELMERVLGAPAPGSLPFSREVLTWALLAVLPEYLKSPPFAPLAAYVAAGADGRERQVRLYQLCTRIADCFDQYAIARPDWVLAWDARVDADRFQPPEQRWQPLLWQALRDRVNWGAAIGQHPAALEQAFVARLAQAGGPPPLPERILLFGIASLPPMYLRMLSALAAHTRVHLFCTCPAPELMRAIEQPTLDLAAEPALFGCRDDLHQALTAAVIDPLLASFAQQPLEFLGLLQCQVVVNRIHRRFGPPAGRAPATFLGALKQQLLGRRPAPGPDPADGSLSVHACHSPLREVEVLQDQLRRLFTAQPDLKPADVIVMAPDMEVYAPLIAAVFNAGAAATRIPTAVSDRAFRREMPVIDGLLALLDLGPARRSLGEVAEFLAREPVRERFGFSQAELDQLLAWLQAAGVRWGADADHRTRFDQPAYAENTWRFGLERLLLGATLPAADADGTPTFFAGRLPAALAEGLAAEPLGRLAEFVELLFGLLDELARPRPLAAWRELLLRALSVLFADAGPWAYQHQALRAQLEGLVRAAEALGLTEPMEAEIVRAHLAGAFDDMTSGRGFLSGAVTFCKLLPMRSVPYRVVCLLGMNDGAFPRDPRPLGFDLMAALPRPGDRSTRIDDRHQFLEAVLAAEDALVITYAGQGIQTNETKPPATVLAALLDAAAEICPLAQAGETIDQRRDRLITRQPLQPFSPRLFSDAEPGVAPLQSFDRRQLEPARALVGPRIELGPFQSEDLAPAEDEGRGVDLADLLRFYRNPAETMLRQRLGIVLPEAASSPPTREPLNPDGLAEYQLGDTLVTTDAPAAAVCTLARAQGILPPGALGQAYFERVQAEAQPVRQQALGLDLGAALPPRPFELALGPDRLCGSLTALRAGGRLVLTYSKLHGRHLLRFWIEHLALCAQDDGQLPRVSVLVGRPHKDVGLSLVRLASERDQARDQLAALCALFREGLRAPLRLFPQASFLFARSEAADALASARRSFESGDHHQGEDADAYVHLAFGDTDPLDDLPAQDPRSFPALSEAVFGPLLAALAGGGS